VLRAGCHIRYHIASILALHWAGFVRQYKGWIRQVVFENVRKVLSCRTPVLGCHVYEGKGCGHVQVVPHSCKSRFCPTCGKHATDVWADKVLNGLLDVPYHHIILSIPWQLRIVIGMNRKAGINLLVTSAKEAVQRPAETRPFRQCCYARGKRCSTSFNVFVVRALLADVHGAFPGAAFGVWSSTLTSKRIFQGTI